MERALPHQARRAERSLGPAVNYRFPGQSAPSTSSRWAPTTRWAGRARTRTSPTGEKHAGSPERLQPSSKSSPFCWCWPSWRVSPACACALVAAATRCRRRPTSLPRAAAPPGPRAIRRGADQIVIIDMAGRVVSSSQAREPLAIPETHHHPTDTSAAEKRSPSVAGIRFHPNGTSTGGGPAGSGAEGLRGARQLVHRPCQRRSRILAPATRGPADRRASRCSRR